VAVCAHDDEIGPEGRGTGQQKATHVLAAGGQPPHFRLGAVTSQVARDVRSRLLAVARKVAVTVHD
jgi:hypothetical protein